MQDIMRLLSSCICSLHVFFLYRTHTDGACMCRLDIVEIIWVLGNCRLPPLLSVGVSCCGGSGGDMMTCRHACTLHRHTVCAPHIILHNIGYHVVPSHFHST